MRNVEFSLGDGSAIIGRLRTLRLFRWMPQSLPGRIVFTSLLAWAPLLIFTAHEGVAIGDKVQVPFLADLVQYARFLVALPCTILIGNFINPRLRNVLKSFLRRGIVLSRDVDRFESLISRSAALAGSIIPEFVILAAVYTYTSMDLYIEASTGISTWNHAGKWSDWWFVWVSMPLLLFRGFLWLWRLGVWAGLLFRISRFELRVVATHPDGVGGLNFVNVGMRRFSLLVFAISAILCASIGEEILVRGVSLRSYESEVALCFLICLVGVLGPLMVFTPKLTQAKLEYWGKYGALGSRYVQRFDDKWTSEAGYSREDLLGSPDIQSLADLKNSYSVISQMRTLLPNQATLTILAFAYVLPVLPLLATVMSLRRVITEVYTLLLK